MKTLKTTALKQSGAVLPVAMVMLLISTLVGLASIRSTTEQAKISANMYSRSLAYQAAEAALQAAEKAIDEADAPDKKKLGENCLSENHLALLKTGENINPPCPAIPTSTFTKDEVGWFQAPLTTTSGKEFLIADLKPQYYIERMELTRSGGSSGSEVGDDPYKASNSANADNYGEYFGGGVSQRLIYRITARSGVPSSENNRSIVALQATFEQNL